MPRGCAEVGVQAAARANRRSRCTTAADTRSDPTRVAFDRGLRYEWEQSKKTGGTSCRIVALFAIVALLASFFRAPP
jgi:hypothetical protein